ncbi:hypothetical protein PG984_015288 [Apiospora sp. TS-2023a]
MLTAPNCIVHYLPVSVQLILRSDYTIIILNKIRPRHQAMMDQEEFVTPAQYSLPSSSAGQELTPLDLVTPALYGTRWILCFPLSPEADKEQMLETTSPTYSRQLTDILADFRICVSGWRIPSMLSHGSPETLVQIVDSSSGGVTLRYNDLTSDLPSYGDLKQQRFPLEKLSTAQLSPVGVMPEPPAPVMAAQANFIQGGLLLTVALHHTAGDASAFETILSVWARNTAAGTSGSNDFATYDALSNDRSRLMQGTPPPSMESFPEYILRPEENQQKIFSVDDKAPPPSGAAFQLPPMACRIFYFSGAKLADLKQEASAYSTNDALGAFLWCQMTAARNPSSSSSDLEGKVSAFAYAVNTRSRMSPPLPPTYLGNGSVGSMTDRLPVSELVAAGGQGGGNVKRAAAAIRKSLQRFESPSHVAETVGLLASRADPSDFKHAFHAFLGPDVVASSWADVKVYDQNWGGELGSPELFRFPGDGADGAIVVLPRHPGEDGLEVAMGLELGAMGRLLESKEFQRFAEVRC